MFHECDVCGGSTFMDLGILGNLRHLRCRDCGANSCYTLDRETAAELIEDEYEQGVDSNYGAW
jgi:hypothetical protein